MGKRTASWGIIALGVVLTFAQPARAFIEADALIGYRDFSSQAQNGGSFFYPEVGARAVLLNRSELGLEFLYARTGSKFGTITVTEHRAQAGIRLAPKVSSKWQPLFLLGLSYYYSHYAGAQNVSDPTQRGLYLGLGTVYDLGLLALRADVTQTIFAGLLDSSTAFTLSMGVSL